MQISNLSHFKETCHAIRNYDVIVGVTVQPNLENTLYFLKSIWNLGKFAKFKLFSTDSLDFVCKYVALPQVQLGLKRACVIGLSLSNYLVEKDCKWEYDSRFLGVLECSTTYLNKYHFDTEN